MKKISKKNLEKVIALIVLLLVLLLVYEVAHIYALFYSELNSNVKLTNGTWNISVNGTDVTSGKDIEFKVDNFSTEENDHVEPGKLAPGLTGKFKVIIDPTDTNVSIKYDISLIQENLKNQNIIIKSIILSDGTKELVKTAQSTYTGVILLEQINKKNAEEITVEIEWLDNENDNKTDIETGTSEEAKIEIPITIHFSQYLGEEIVEYTDSSDVIGEESSQ